MAEIKFSEGREGHYFDLLSKKVWQKAISQPQKQTLMEVGEADVIPFIQKVLKQMHELEREAEKPLLERIGQEDAAISAIWCPSAPGTWSRPWKKDRYERIPYTKWWDRSQVIASIKLSIAIGRLKAGFPVSGRLSRESQKEALDLSPPIIYNGRPDENEALRHAIGQGGYQAELLQQLVHLIDTDRGNKYNSLDQVRSFSLPNEQVMPGDRIGIVIRPGQTVRLMHFFGNPANLFPQGVVVKLFTLGTGFEGLPHPHIQEACGILYYRFTTGDAAEEPYPYEY